MHTGFIVFQQDYRKTLTIIDYYVYFVFFFKKSMRKFFSGRKIKTFLTEKLQTMSGIQKKHLFHAYSSQSQLLSQLTPTAVIA